MSNIEDDLKEKGFIEAYKQIKNNASIIKSVDKDFFFELVDYLLSEREQDKARIKELEEENMEKDLEKIGIQQDTEANMKEIIEKYYTANEKCIPKQREKEMQAKIKELEAKLEFKKYGDLDEIEFEEYMSHFIPKQKVKDILNEIQEEYDKVQEQFDCIWDKKSKDNYDRYKLQELSAMQQELGFILGKFEELLEEGD